jgi:hypothetical protein
MKIEFNTPEEYELFRRVMEAVKNQPPTPAWNGQGMGASPFSMTQEQELLHKPEVGVTRFGHSIAPMAPVVSNRGFPYGSKGPWTYTTDRAVVSIHNGRVERYPDRIDATNPTNITFTSAGDFWIGYLFETQSNTLTITGPLSAEPYTGDAGHEDDVAEGRYRGALYKFTATVDGTSAVNSITMARDYIHGRFDPQVTT